MYASFGWKKNDLPYMFVKAEKSVYLFFLASLLYGRTFTNQIDVLHLNIFLKEEFRAASRKVVNEFNIWEFLFSGTRVN